MADYHIVKDNKDKDKPWAIKRAGGKKASARASTKEKALKIAAKFTEKSDGGEVREHASRDGSVHKKGQIIDNDTHGKPDPKGNG